MNYYIPKKPCLRGHFKRYKHDGKCVECHLIFKKYRSQLHSLLKSTDLNSKHIVLGYSRCDLEKHLECNFTPYMNWDNYGDVWHIDHKISIKKFIDINVYESKIINSLYNIQPLYWQENLKKSWR